MILSIIGMIIVMIIAGYAVGELIEEIKGFKR